MVVATIWWLAFFTAVGLCLGSFLNVVIFRLPAGLAVNEPRWSFCPNCHNRIAWYDNLPVISFLRLRGRCRHCWFAIPWRYPAIELATAVVVLLLLDAFVVGRMRDGLSGGFDLNWRLAEDWPILLAHIVLFAALLAMSAIDLECYWVDIRFTHLAALAGAVLHTAWTPAHSVTWLRPHDITAAGCVAVLLGFGVVWFLMQRGRGAPTSAESDTAATVVGPPLLPPGRSTSSGRVWLLIAWVSLMWVSIAQASLTPRPAASLPVRAAIGFAFLVGLTLCGGASRREMDTQIMEAIESESPQTRRRAFQELLHLLPGMVLGAAVVWWLLGHRETEETVRSVIRWEPFDGDWRPLWGLGTAVSGYVLAASIGWAVRIVSNLAFGKEAFGTGDIHMMAAAGAVAGWPVVLLGFVLTCFLALGGWLILLPIKRTRAIPLGPWLSLGLLVAAIFYRPIVSTPLIQNTLWVVNWMVRGDEFGAEGSNGALESSVRNRSLEEKAR